MNFLICSGSPRKKGNTVNIVKSLCGILDTRKHTYDIIKAVDVKPCVHCSGCKKTSNCVLKDSMSKALNDFDKYDGIIICGPVYFFTFNSLTQAFIERLYCKHLDNKLIGTIIVSGSDYHESGAPNIVNQFNQINNYCGCNYLGYVHKQTNDLILETCQSEISYIRKLIDKFEVRYNYGIETKE